MRTLSACAVAVLLMAASAWAVDDDKIQVKPFIKSGTYVMTGTMTSTSEDDLGKGSKERGDFVFELSAASPDDAGQKLLLVGKTGRLVITDAQGAENVQKDPWPLRYEFVVDKNGDVVKFKNLPVAGEPSPGPSQGRFEMGKPLPQLILATSQPVTEGQSWEAKNGDKTIIAKCKLLKLTKDSAQFEIQMESIPSSGPDKHSQKAKLIVQYDRNLQAATAITIQQESKSEWTTTGPDGSHTWRSSSKTYQEITLTPGKYVAASQPASAPVPDKN